MFALKTIKKWAIRIAIGAATLVILTGIGITAGFAYWKSQHVKSLESNSEIIATAHGDIEVAIRGQGTPQLFIHGRPGGYDQSLIGWKVFPEFYADRRLIAISRPGYLRTPVTSGKSPADQADLYAALMDSLGIDKTIVYAASGGGPSGLQFALRYPERVQGLILVVPLLQAKGVGTEFNPPSSTENLLQEMLTWLLGKRLITSIIPAIDLNDPIQKQLAEALIDTSLPGDRRIAGIANDHPHFQKLDVDSWNLEGLTVPTLIIHGTADENAPYEGSKKAAERLPNAKLITFPGDDHYVVITKIQEINQHVGQFISSLGD